MKKTQAPLFIGFRIDPIYQNELNRIDPYLLKAQLYDLEIVNSESQQWIGKTADAYLTLTQIEQIEQNIYSRLKKVVVDYLYDETPLYIFPFIDD